MTVASSAGGRSLHGLSGLLNALCTEGEVLQS